MTVTVPTGGDAHAIHTAIASLLPTGGVVALAGTHDLGATTVIVPPNVTLQGDGWGTNLTGAANPLIRLTGSASSVRHLAIVGEPPTAIQVTGPDAWIEDVFLQRPDVGVSIFGTGRTTIQRLHGQPRTYGLLLDKVEDVVRANDVHFWPYSGDLTLAAQGTAICLRRADNPQLSNIFAYGYAVGLELGASAYGCAHKVHLANADFDSCHRAIVVDAGQLAPTLFGACVTGQHPIKTPALPAIDLVSCGRALLTLTSCQFLLYSARVARAPAASQAVVTVDGTVVVGASSDQEDAA